MNRHILTGLSGFILATSLIACGDDATGNCGPGTELQNGVCVAVTTTDATGTTDTSTTGTTDTSTTGTTTSTTDTSTTGGTDVGIDTTTGPDVSGECTEEEAGKSGLGAACTKSCQCNQALKGKPLECYAGPYLEGFSFCTRQVDNTLSEQDGAESIVWISGCLTDTNLTPSTKKIYVKGCTTLADCKSVAAAYDACGTQELDYAVTSGTECPCWNTSNGGYMSGCHMTNNSCVITTLPPFNGDYVKIP